MIALKCVQCPDKGIVAQQLHCMRKRGCRYATVRRWLKELATQERKENND